MPYSGSASMKPAGVEPAARGRPASSTARSTTSPGPSRVARRAASMLVDPCLDRRVRPPSSSARRTWLRPSSGRPLASHVASGSTVDLGARQPRDGRQRRDEGRLGLGQAGRAPAASMTACRDRVMARGTPRRSRRPSPGPSGIVAQPSLNGIGVASRPARCGLSSTPYLEEQLVRRRRAGRVRQAGQDLQTGRDAQGVVRRVRHRRDRVGRGEVGDPERVRDAAADDRLGLDDVDGAPRRAARSPRCATGGSRRRPARCRGPPRGARSPSSSSRWRSGSSNQVKPSDSRIRPISIARGRV